MQTLTKISTSHVLFGAHGAGLSNILFARKGAVLVDFLDAGSGVYRNIFPRMTVANDGHAILIRTPGKGTRGLDPGADVSARAFRCAAALLQNSNLSTVICRHADILVKSHDDVMREDHGKVWTALDPEFL